MLHHNIGWYNGDSLNQPEDYKPLAACRFTDDVSNKQRMYVQRIQRASDNAK